MIATALRWQILPRASRGFGLRLAGPALARCYASSSFPPHTVIKMPALSPTMTAGNIGTWQKKPGDTIAPGDVLVEIETDKAQMDFEFQDDGVIAKLLKESGEKDVPVGNPIAVLVEEGTDISAFSNFSLDDAGGEAAAPAPKKKDSESSSDGGDKSDSSKTTTPAPEPEPESTAPPSGAPQSSLAREPNMSFRTKDLAIKLGVDIGSLKGSGTGGRITDEDVKKASASGSGGAGGAGAGAAGARYEDIPLSNMRKTIASRLRESTQNNPHYFVTSTLSVTRLLKLRSSLNQSADGRYKLSVNDFIIKAVAVASRRVPAVNASWRDDTIRQFNTVDVSVAVATPTGLITPIVTGCEARGLASISSRVKELAVKARDGALKPEEYLGGTVSISNMGMNSAVDHFTAIINPPQAAILAVGTTKKTAIPGEDGQVVWDDQMSVTASFDHKVIDGAVGAEWMLELKKVIENPLELLL